MVVESQLACVDLLTQTPDSLVFMISKGCQITGKFNCSPSTCASSLCKFSHHMQFSSSPLDPAFITYKSIVQRVLMLSCMLLLLWHVIIDFSPIVSCRPLYCPLTKREERKGMFPVKSLLTKAVHGQNAFWLPEDSLVRVVQLATVKNWQRG